MHFQACIHLWMIRYDMWRIWEELSNVWGWIILTCVGISINGRWCDYSMFDFPFDVFSDSLLRTWSQNLMKIFQSCCTCSKRKIDSYFFLLLSIVGWTSIIYLLPLRFGSLAAVVFCREKSYWDAKRLVRNVTFNSVLTLCCGKLSSTLFQVSKEKCYTCVMKQFTPLSSNEYCS